MKIKCIYLRNWKQRRQDKKTEEHWVRNPPTNGWQEYQKEWNFIETEYNDRPSSNGLDLGNPGFAFETKFVKYLVPIEIEV